jgi:hypothetical protein
MVHAAGYQFRIVELERTNSAGVPSETPKLSACFEIPYTRGTVIRTCDEDGERGSVRERLGELETHDAVGVSFESAYTASSAPPVSLDGKSLAVDVLPRTGNRG